MLSRKFKLYFLLSFLAIIGFFSTGSYIFYINHFKDIVKNEYWTDLFGPIQLTSYNNRNYGFFYTNFTFNIAYKKAFIGEKIENNIFEIKEIIKKEISKENYYRINTNFKRSINLIPQIIDKISKLLFLRPNQILDIYFETFFIDLVYHSSNFDDANKIIFFNLGHFYFQYFQKHYKVNLYLIYDEGNSLLSLDINQGFNPLKKHIQSKLDFHFLSSEKNNIDINKEALEKLIESKIDQVVKEYFRDLNKEYKFHYRKSIPPSTLVAYCIEDESKAS